MNPRQRRHKRSRWSVRRELIYIAHLRRKQKSLSIFSKEFVARCTIMEYK